MSERHIHDNSCWAERQTCGRGQHVHVGPCYVSDDPGNPDARSRVVCPHTEHEHDSSCVRRVTICGND